MDYFFRSREDITKRQQTQQLQQPQPLLTKGNLYYLLQSLNDGMKNYIQRSNLDPFVPEANEEIQTKDIVYSCFELSSKLHEIK
eukprot:Awhi_evm1s3023